MNHIDDDVLSAYGLDPDSVDDRAAVEGHLEECEVCRDGAAAYREIDAALRGPQTWATVDGVLNRSDRLEEILVYRRRTEGEERDARALLARVGSSPLKFRNAAIAEKARYHTEGMVRVLCAEANARHEQRPRFSQLIAAAAYRVATNLTGVPERAKRALMGMALREHANALRYLGRFKDALKLLDYAEKLFDGAPATDPFDLAIVTYIRAGIFQNLGRLDEGIAAARAAADVFRGYGDVTRERCALMVEANCVLRSGRAAEAVATYGQVIALSRASGDARMLARGLSNCAAALKDLREFDRAERFYIEALSLYDEFDMRTEKARVEWVLAMIVVARGEYRDGARRLDSVRKDLAKLGLTNDAALATLMWAEARLLAGRTAGVVEACRNIIVVFENEAMHRHAMHALAVLNEAMATGRGTPRLIREVWTYLENLPRKPAEEFALLQ
jgi:tetratricopeptide (TPR) repeat protein